MKKIFGAIAVSSVFILVSCNENNTPKENIETEEPETIFGTYAGTIPCADCPGIDETLTLNADSTFILQSIYQERNEGKAFIDSGAFKVENGKVVLSIKGGSPFYKIKKDTLEQLNLEGNEIESGNFKLVRK